MRIAINGAGIAGPTLAYWLRASGHEVLLVEESPKPRTGGYVIDFWGVGYDIAERMGLRPRVEAQGYRVREVAFVDGRGRRRGGFPVEAFTRALQGRFTSLHRSDLAAILLEALDGGVQMRFGDSIASIDDDGSRVRLGFEHAGPCEVDLVVGADGLHSRVRSLVFGPDAQFEHGLGYHVAAFEAQGYRPRDELVYVSYAAPGRQLSRFAMRGDRTLFLFIFRDEHLHGARPSSEAERKAALKRAFDGAGWECARILAEMDAAGAIYFDRVSQIRMDRWTRGRTALVGDAAACVSLLAGEGTGLAMAEARVLAAELEACRGDHAAAFARYEARMQPFLRGKQRMAARFASSLVPKTGAGIAFRNVATGLLRIPAVADYLVGRAFRDDIEL